MQLSGGRRSTFSIAIVVLGLLFINVVLLLIFSASFIPRAADQTSPRLLKFSVCNGFANQRLSVVYGVVLAKYLKRSIILPTMIRTGTQYTGNIILPGQQNMLDFHVMYNKSAFVNSIRRHGINVYDGLMEFSNLSVAEVNLDMMSDPMEMLQDVYSDVPVLSVGCVLFKVPPSYMDQHNALIWTALESLVPTNAVQRYVNYAVARLKTASPHQSFNFLHMRAERDWVQHCERWSATASGTLYGNCFNNTDQIAQHLRLAHFNTSIPLYVAAYWQDMDSDIKQQLLSRMRLAGYNVWMFEEVHGLHFKLDREAAALVDYFVAMAAERFIGNSVSTFSALLIMQRRRQKRWASYYNGGGIPLEALMPLDQLPWIFTFNSNMSSYEYMLKAAVHSAVHVGRLLPYCLYTGNASHPMLSWFASQGVTIVQHKPAWQDALKTLARPLLADNLKHSHLYSSVDAMIGTFQRIDVPIMPELDQYIFALYTDSDVFFRTQVNLSSFQLPLPLAIGMAYEMGDRPPYNAGVMLMNLQTLRVTYDMFLQFILTNTAGLYFEGHGPGDQGAYNQFYEGSIAGYKLPGTFNARPYEPYQPDSLVLHFHGPKPHEYAAFIESGNCRFGDLCQQGIRNGVCKYMADWQQHVVAMDKNVSTLQQFCRALERKRHRKAGHHTVKIGAWHVDFRHADEM